MNATRRDFIKSLGIGMASLLMAQCTLSDDGTDLTKSPQPSPKEWLRIYWLRIGDLAAETQEDFERAEQIKAELITDHRAALDNLVASEELSSAAAEQVQIAFQEATYHVWRSNAPITCYEPVLVDYTPTSSEQLTQKVALLEEIAERSDIEENTLAQAQAALERDIAFLGLTDEETQLLYEKLITAAGDTNNFPSFDELDLEITPEAMEAARFLVELFIKDER
jgi:hypothetical protein